MAARKYTRVSDTGIVLHVSRSLSHGGSVGLYGAPNTATSFLLETEFSRSYADTNYTAPAPFEGTGDKDYNRAGTYFSADSRKAISSFYTTFGSEPVVDVARVDSAGRYRSTVARSSRLADSRLSKDVFGDPMFYAATPSIFASIVEGTDSNGTVVYDDLRYAVSFSGINPEFEEDVVVSTATDDITANVHSQVFSQLIQVTGSFEYPSDGLALVDGGHLYRSFMADTRAQFEPVPGTLTASPLGQADYTYSRGISALGLLPKTEVYEIPANNADFVQYPGKSTDRSKTSYSPRYDARRDEFLPATGDADLRGFHGQFWISSKRFDDTFNNVNGQFTRGKANRPVPFGPKSDRRSYSADTVGGIYALDASSVPDVNIDFTLNADLSLERGKFVYDPVFNEATIMPDITGSTTRNPDRVQDYRSLLMAATFVSSSLNYPLTSADLYTAIEEPMVEKLRTMTDNTAFDTIKVAVQTGLSEVTADLFDDEYPYVRHLIAMTAGDAYYANHSGMLESEDIQPRPELVPIANNLTDYIDPGLMPFSNPEGVLPVKLDLANPANIVLYDSLRKLSPTIDYNDSSTYDFSAFSNSDYASYLGMVNLGNQGSFDIIGATARMEHANVVIWAAAQPQKTINKLRFSSNTVSRSAFSNGDKIVLTPDKEAAFGKILLRDGIVGVVRAAITSGTFDRFNTSLPARPTKIQIGDPIRIYFGGEKTLTTLPPISEAITVNNIGSDVTDLILNTTEGPISLIRDIGLTINQLQSLTYFDLSDSRLTPIPAITPDGISVVLRSELVLRPQVDSIDLVTTKNTANLSLKYIILHHLQEFNFKHEYFNNAGHVAHSMYRDPMSTIRIGTKQNPVRDPGFIQSEGGAAAARLSAFGYPLDQNTIPVVRQEGVANVDVQVYNPMFGVPDILRGQVQNSIYEFDTSHDVNYRTGKVPFMRQGFVYNENVTVELNEEMANLEAMGYAQTGEVPRQELTPARYNYKTDIFGRVRIFGIPSEESPVFDSNGRIGLIYGGDVKIVVPKNNGQQFPGHPYPYDRTESKVLPIVLLAGYENAEGIQIVLKNRAPAGLLPVDQERVGVAFRTILANPSGVPLTLQRIGNSGITTEILSSPALMAEMEIMADTSLYQDASSLLFSEGISIPPKEFRHIPLTIEWSDKDGTRYQVERDNGVINYNAEGGAGTKTVNLLHPRNSKVGAGYNGVFYYGEDAQAQMMFNYMYVDLLPESLGTIRYPGFFNKTVRAGILDPEKFNALTVLRDPIQPTPNRSAIANAQGTTVRISPSAYTLSDDGTYAAFQSSNNSIMPANNHGSISAMVGMQRDSLTYMGYTIQQRFLNFPIRATEFQGYANRLYNNDINVTRPSTAPTLTSYIYGQDYVSRRFGVDAKMVNYALGPADLFFGSATVNEGDVRQITKVMDFGMELAEYVEYPTQTEATTPNYVNVNATTVYNFTLPPGTYSFIFNIQDMLIPGDPGKYGNMPFFTPSNENGLRSNFYWNLPASTINEGLFSESPTYTRSASMVSAIGYVTGTVIDNDVASEVRGNLRITIQPAEDFSISPITDPYEEAYEGKTCDKGILYPDPTNRDIGTNGMQAEGSPAEQGPNGEFRQAYKVIRVDVYTDVAIPWRKLQNVAGLAVSFRPNSTIPSEFLVPTSTDGMNADRYTLYGIDGYPSIPRGEYPCFARIGSVAFYHSLYPNAFIMLAEEPVIGPKYINGLPGDPFDHLPEKKQVQLDNGATQATGLSFTELCVNTTPTPDEIYTVKTMLGFHSVLAPGETPLELDIPINALDINNSICQSVNRSILDMGGGLNIINLAGVATQGDYTLPTLQPLRTASLRLGGNA